MTSPTPAAGVYQAFITSTPDPKRPKLRLESSPHRVPEGIRAWQRRVKSGSSTTSSGKGLGMGMTSTPAKSKSKSKSKSASSIGWQSTPLAQQRQPGPFSDTGNSSDPEQMLNTFSDSQFQQSSMRELGDKRESSENASEGISNWLIGTETLFHEPQDFLVPLNDVSDYVHAEEDIFDYDMAPNAGQEDEDESIELGRAADGADALFPDLHDRLGCGDDYEAYPDQPPSEITDDKGDGSDESLAIDPWLVSPPPLSQVASPTPTFPSPMRYSPHVFSTTSPSSSTRSWPASQQQEIVDTHLDLDDVLVEQETIRLGRRRRQHVWRGRDFLESLRKAQDRRSSLHSIEEEDNTSPSEISLNSVRRKTVSKRRSHVTGMPWKSETSSERVQAHEKARAGRIAHYRDLERNYKLAEEWVLW